MPYPSQIFQRRVNLKPYEYPNLLEYKDAIRQSYWVHDEFESEFNRDVQDYRVSLTSIEKDIIKKTMLAIAQIEVNVKEFWGDIFKYLPKPEIGAVGYTFAESEVRHFDAYSHLLDLLGLGEEFENISSVGAIADRIKYLDEYTRGHKSQKTNESYTLSLLLFSSFVEHISLFSQFLILMSFNRHKQILSGISNAVEATSKEEQIHGDFGIHLISLIYNENPSWFTEETEDKIHTACEKAYKAETKILDWIFEKGELDFLPRRQIDAFIRNRFNKALSSVNTEEIYTIDKEDLRHTKWFDEEIISSSHVDFFHKRPTSYSKNNKSFSPDDLF